jgi:hypothetical protein
MPQPIYIPPLPQQQYPARNALANVLQNLAMARIQNKMELERAKTLGAMQQQQAVAERTAQEQAARQKLQMQGEFQAGQEGRVPIETQVGAVQPGSVRIGEQWYGAPASPKLYEVAGVQYVLSPNGTLMPIKREAPPGPEKAQGSQLDFEMTIYGKQVPEERGTQEYIKKRLDWIKQTKEASPYIGQMQQQMEIQKNQQGTNLRKEFNQLPIVKNFIDINNKFDIMNEAMKESKEAKNFVAIDQALITVFNKITDPSSVVRESEYARTSNDLSILNRIRGKIDKLSQGGPGLTQDDREAIYNMAKKFQQVSKSKFNQRFREYKGYARDYGLDPNKYLRPEVQEAASEMYTPAGKEAQAAQAATPAAAVQPAAAAGSSARQEAINLLNQYGRTVDEDSIIRVMEYMSKQGR